mmetsp:Transcript_24653/g.51201  ORF Transcript_24653/g.51201 Transcript_24653/m.51201 type:complete len:546 (-) Transcript_24653:72-1709(-)
MVKRPQSQLGYFVDGKLVSCPGSQRKPGSLVEAEKEKRFHGGLGLRSYPKKKLKTLSSSEQSDFYVSAMVQNYKPAKQLSKKGIYDDDLKNAVKVNNMHGVLEVIGAFVTNTGVSWEPKTFERLVTQVLFKKNMEQRRPLYYACLCGHERCVDFFTKLYVVAASRRLSGCEAFDDVAKEEDKRRTTPRTFNKWCELLGFWNGTFERMDYEVSWLSSLNQRIRDKLDSSPFSLAQAETYLYGERAIDKVAHTVATRNVRLNQVCWTRLCTVAAEEVMKTRQKRRWLARKVNKKPTVNTDGLSVDHVVFHRRWEDEDEEKRVQAEDWWGEGEKQPPRPKLSRQNSAEAGRLVFQRAVSGSKEDLLKDHGNFPSIAQGLALDDGSFELVSVSDEEDWELIMNEEMLRMNVNDNDDDDNEGEGEGEDDGVAATQSEARSWADVLREQSTASQGARPVSSAIPPLASRPKLLQPKRSKMAKDDVKADDGEIDEREMYKSTRAGRVRGDKRGDRHRGRHLEHFPKGPKRRYNAWVHGRHPHRTKYGVGDMW